MKFYLLNEVKEIENNKKLEIRGYAELEKIIFNSNQVPYSIEVIYKNEDGNKYKQKLSKQGSGYKLTNPEILDKE